LTFIIAGDEQSEISTRQRLLPVIAELLFFSEQEKSTASSALETQKARLNNRGGGALIGRAFGGISSLLGGGDG
jgi:hypothetical protein